MIAPPGDQDSGAIWGMKMKQPLFSNQVLRWMMAGLLATTSIAPVFGNGDHKHASSRNEAAAYDSVSIDNFGRVNENMYRGAQPKGEEYKQLANLGIKTIVDLRADADKDSKPDAERAGLRYINLAMINKKYPEANAADKFLEVANNQENWPMYVHCAGGRHRTGSMIAVYRMTMDNWTIDRAYDEMKKFDFYTSRGHGCYKDYVYDFYRTMPKQPNRQLYMTQSARGAVAADSQGENRAPVN
jgi:protein tyrosine phosphatase (PTP) superfamily phosphohydrolase (DUF442 family)